MIKYDLLTRATHTRVCVCVCIYIYIYIYIYVCVCVCVCVCVAHMRIKETLAFKSLVKKQQKIYEGRLKGS